jgi:CubicO group peptidase (beta-lactamase class C family)
LLAGSLASGSTGEVGLVLASTPKLIVPLLAVSTISIIATALFWWRSRRLPLAVALTTAAFAIACLLPLQVPFDTVPSGVNAAYSMTTTSEDLGRFVVELSSLDQRTPPLNGMLREQVAIDPERAWGLGIGIEKGPGGATYWHSGINLGTRALIVIDPQTRTAIVVLANAEHGLDLARDVAELALGIRGRWDVPRAG